MPQDLTIQLFAAAPPSTTISAHPKSTPAFPKHAISQSQIRLTFSPLLLRYLSPVPVVSALTGDRVRRDRHHRTDHLCPPRISSATNYTSSSQRSSRHPSELLSQRPSNLSVMSINGTNNAADLPIQFKYKLVFASTSSSLTTSPRPA
jgi:hypothetical protein